MKRACTSIVFLCLPILIFFYACSSKDAGVQEGDESIFHTLSDSQDSKGYDYSSDEYYAINSYLTLFTRTGFMKNSSFTHSNTNDLDFLRLARLLIMTWHQDLVETVKINNEDYCRVSEEDMNTYLYTYLKVKLMPQDNENIFYDDGYYYWNKPEAESHLNSSFALIDRIESLGNNYFSVNFSLFNSRSNMADSFDKKYLKYSKTEAILQFPRGRLDDLNAIINTKDLSDTGEMRLAYMQKNSNPAN